MKSERIKLTSPEAFINAFNRAGQLQENDKEKPTIKQNVPKSMTNG